MKQALARAGEAIFRLAFRKSAARTRLVHCPDHEWFGVLRQKLKWGER